MVKKILTYYLFLSIITFSACDNRKSAENNSDSDTTDLGVIINGVTWATRNVSTPGSFAEFPESTGMFYQWNRRVGWSATSTVSNWNASEPSGTEWEPENDPCPEGWRVPRKAELRSLETKTIGGTETPWTIINGVAGRNIMSGENSIFLPAVGMRASNGTIHDGGFYLEGPGALYWSSTMNDGFTPYHLCFVSRYGIKVESGISSAVAMPIRCVAK